MVGGILRDARSIFFKHKHLVFVVAFAKIVLVTIIYIVNTKMTILLQTQVSFCFVDIYLSESVDVK